MLATITAYPRLLAGLFGLVLALFLLDARADDPSAEPPVAESFEDPLPIQRVLLPKDRVTAELQRAKQGALIRLSRTEFEQRVRQAAIAARQAPEPPRLVEAHYRARLIDDRLEENSLRGTAEWKMAYTGTSAGLLPLDSLQIALKDARWPDNRPAVIGFLDPRPQSGMALLVESAGEQALAMEWSSRGVPQPGELRFDLAVLPSPIATLELELPSHLRPLFPQDEVVCTGPEPVDDEGKSQSWNVSFGGLDHLEISVRHFSASQPAPPIQSAIAARHDLSTGQALSQFAFDFKVLRRDLTEMLVEHDPELTITDVSAFNLESWRALNGLFGGKRRMTVRFREPVVGGQLRVSAVSALPFNDATPWATPAMQIVGAIPRGETIRLHVGPDLRLLEWRSGAFRLLRQEAAADHSQTLWLESSHLPENQTTLARPLCRFRSSGTEFRVQQKNSWDIAADRSTFDSDISLHCDRGTLNRFSLRVPPGWSVEKVEAAASEINPIWTLVEGANPQLQVELPKGVLAGNDIRLLVRLRQPMPSIAMGVPQAVAIPDVMPLGARSRRGELIIRLSPAFQASSPTHSDSFHELELGPSNVELIDRSRLTYPFHGQPPAGPILLRRVAPRFNATIESTISVVADIPAVATRMTIKPESGAINRLILSSSDHFEGSRNWQTLRGDSRVQSLESLPIGAVFSSFGSPTLFGPLVDIAEWSRAKWWLMTFSRPIDSETVFERTDNLPARSANQHGGRAVSIGLAGSLLPENSSPDFFRVPLLGVHGTSETKGTVIVKSEDRPSWRFETAGLTREYARQPVGSSQSQWRYTAANPSLTMRRVHEPKTAPIRIDRAELHVVANSTRDQRCLLLLRVQVNNQRKLELGLPSSARILKAAISGRTMSGDLISARPNEDRMVHELPFPAGREWQRMEVLFEMPSQSWTFSTELAPPFVEFPALPSDFKIVWHLPPGVSPADPSKLVRRPSGPDLDSAGVGGIGWWLSTNSPEVRERSPSDAERKAAAGIKNPATRNFQQFLGGSGGLAEKPILDTQAIEELGLQPTTPAAGSSWDAFGLVFVTTPAGSVLTSPRQLSLWRADSATTHSLPMVVGSAISEASRHGRDRTGRFRSVDDWIESSSATSSLAGELGGEGPGWTTWETHGTSKMAELGVVNVRHADVLGWILAALLGCFGVLAMGRLGRSGIWLLIVWLMACGILLLLLPVAWRGLASGPMAAGLLVAVLSSWIRRQRAGDAKTVVHRKSTHNRLLPASAVSILLILIGGWLTVAAPSESHVVYLLPATGPNQEPRTVLASPELMDRLTLMSKPRLALAESAIVRARYSGRSATSGLAEFDAQFDIISFSERTTISLPLSGLRLREALLGGAAAYPKPSDGDRTVFEIRGKGEHRLQLKFSAQITINGPDAEFRFATPESAICELEFTQPDDLGPARAVNWRGAQAWSGHKLTADLGRAKSVHVRWRQSGNPGIAQVKVQEASVWDIDPTSATLYSAFDYRISQGSVNSLRVQLPPNVEVARLEVRPETNPVGSPPSWVRDWSIAGNRALKLDLQAPLSGNARLLLELVPIRSLSARPNLQYPVALDAAENEAYLSYRLRGLELPAEVERKGATEFSADSFLRDIWLKIGGERNPLPVSRAFRRGKGETTQVRPALIPAPAIKEVSEESIWSIEPRTAIVEGNIRWSTGGSPTTFVEWEVPSSVAVFDVRGLTVQSWQRTGNRIFAWLREPSTDGAIVWNGSMVRGETVSELAVFEPPVIRVANAAKQTTIIRLRIPEGWVINAENFMASGSPTSPVAPREVAFEITRPGSAPRFQLRAPQTDAAFRLFTIAEVADRQLTAKTTIELQLRRDRPHVFRLKAMHASDWNIALRLPPPCKATPIGSAEWLIETSPRDIDALVLHVDMTRRLETLQTLTIPDIVIETGEHSSKPERRLLLVGSEFREVEMVGYKRLPQPLENLRREALNAMARFQLRGGSLWRAEEPAVQAKVAAAPLQLHVVTPVRIILADLEAVPAGDRWIYRMTLDLHHSSGSKCRMTIPDGMRVEGWAIEGNLSPTPISPGEVDVNLPAEGGSRLVQVVWSTDQPLWETPQITSGGLAIQAERIVWRVSSAPTLRYETSRSLSPAAYNLRKAEAILTPASDVTLNLSDESRARLSNSALRWLRAADNDLARPRDEIARERGPAGVPLAEWAGSLRQRANSLRVGPPKTTPATSATLLREATNEKLPFADAFHMGIPVRWEGAAPADLRLQPVDSPASLPLLARIGLLTLSVSAFGLLVFVLPYSTRFEQVALAGIIGLVAFGFPAGLICLMLVAAAIFLRLGWFGQRAFRWING